MRGKASPLSSSSSPTGITPAYAGKSTSDRAAASSLWDHPRVCGEKRARCLGLLHGQGSPPRMRGKGGGVVSGCRDGGITPAYAGKSRRASAKRFPSGDHPRVCGEKLKSAFTAVESLGSPPRMRGKAIGSNLFYSVYGITPAYAGKRRRKWFITAGAKDHPRVCGEKPVTVRCMVLNLGSPPRMRGKAIRRIHIVHDDGITPAYAGKRLKRSHSIGHFSCILCLFHSVLHRASVSGGSRAGPCAPPCLPAQNAVPV